MQKLHKINVIILWISSIFTIVLITALRGLSSTTIKSDLGMIIGPVIVTLLYFSKANDIIKGSGITIIIAITSLVVSIMQGGNESTYIVSFVMIGMALLYFNKQIITIFLAVYIPISIVAGIINPAYIAGPGSTLALCFERISSYFFLGLLVLIATKRGSGLIDASNNMLAKIKENAQTNSNVISRLNVSMEESSQSIGDLSEQIQGISNATYQMENLAKSMNDSASSLSSLVSETVGELGQNVGLNKEVEKKFEEVGSAVQSGSEGVLEVKNMLGAMKDTVLSAGAASENLLGKISSVNSILNEINKITMRTSMLSINASIEAAKAKEHGKGFTVVANEIKSLADESSESSKRIQQIIEELSVQVDDVASKTSAGVKSAISGMESVERLLTALKDIKSANDTAAKAVSDETRTNSAVNSKFEIVSSEINSLINDVMSIGETIKSVSSDIYRQNDSIKNVNNEIGKMKSVTESLNSGDELAECV